MASSNVAWNDLFRAKARGMNACEIKLFMPWGEKTKPGLEKALASSSRVLADYYWKSFREKE